MGSPIKSGGRDRSRKKRSVRIAASPIAGSFRSRPTSEKIFEEAEKRPTEFALVLTELEFRVVDELRACGRGAVNPDDLMRVAERALAKRIRIPGKSLEPFAVLEATEEFEDSYFVPVEDRDRWPTDEANTGYVPPRSRAQDQWMDTYDYRGYRHYIIRVSHRASRDKVEKALRRFAKSLPAQPKVKRAKKLEDVRFNLLIALAHEEHLTLGDKADKRLGVIPCIARGNPRFSLKPHQISNAVKYVRTLVREAARVAGEILGSSGSGLPSRV